MRRLSGLSPACRVERLRISTKERGDAAMRQEIGRRELLKSALGAAAGVGAARAVDFAGRPGLYAAESGPAPMPVRRLGRTGYRVPLFSLGGQSTIEQPGRRDEAVRIIHRALDLGVNYIDTAAAYGSWPRPWRKTWG
jgi:uncharacterized protein